MEKNEKQQRGFAVMDPELTKEIARKGGLSVSRNTAHMSEIGKRGGAKSAEVRRKKAGI